ncbi:MAG: NAD-dependent protein deacylase [Dehalococcoidia bacterium]|nr:NAD-dependent protein deacylase [Dehalococcoidia bacterium]
MTQTEYLAQLIRESKNTVFFGGAGVSTESGIPDFRSESGLYSAQQNYGFPPEELLSRSLFAQQPKLFYRYYRENLIARHAHPNAAHLALAKLERMGLLKAVITQNIDGLHQAAGSQEVLELHGSNWRQHCIDCSAKYDLDYILSPAIIHDDIPTCEHCGGMVRPDVVLYEESLDDVVVMAATRAISEAELLIVGGTSLAVYPAAGLLQYHRGGQLVLINKSETSYDSRAQLVIRDSIGMVLSQVWQMIDAGQSM